MIDDLLADSRSRMEKSIEVLKQDLLTIRTGRATPALLEHIRVEYYGSPTPLMELATITAPEPQLLAIRPFDPSSLKEITKAIQQSDLGLTPNNDGKMIRLVLPPLTEERRRELTKVVSKRTEEARVAIRNLRRDAQNDLREMEKEKMITEDDLFVGKEKLQEMTDKNIERIDEIGKNKEAEIMEF